MVGSHLYGRSGSSHDGTTSSVYHSSYTDTDTDTDAHRLCGHYLGSMECVFCIVWRRHRDTNETYRCTCSKRGYHVSCSSSNTDMQHPILLIE